MRNAMYDIVENMNLDDHPKSIFTTGDNQTKVRAFCKITKQQIDIIPWELHLRKNLQ